MATTAWPGRLALLLLLALAGSLTGCAEVPRPCVPGQLAQRTLVEPCPPDLGLDPPGPSLCDLARQLPAVPPPPTGRPLQVLALSAGGMYGAFDAGVLAGWSASGRRPVFDVVTGVSTGALIATFAFLGPKYDPLVRESYTNISSDDIFRRKRLLPSLFSDSLAWSYPLEQHINEAITPEVLREVAEAHAQGRRLYVGTTNLDTRKQVIWDLGAIASRGTPEALGLYRRVVLASASVPGLLPPVYFDVEIDGRRFTEMHVDGGASAAVFLEPFMLEAGQGNLRAPAGSNVYVVLSGKPFADPECVRSRFLRVTAASATSALYAGTRGDVNRIYFLALLSGASFQMLAVPQDFPLNPSSLALDQQQMQHLFEVGYRLGLAGDRWRDTPPGNEPGEQPRPRSDVRFLSAPAPGCGS